MNTKSMLAGLLMAASLSLSPAMANEKNLAPGFSQLAKSSSVVVMPVDVELFSMSIGGVLEPRADWTQSAQGHMRNALNSKADTLGFKTLHLDEREADEFGELLALHAAVARSIALHHSVGEGWSLPTKEGKLDWSFAEAMKPIQAKTGAQYGLFVWVRDSYASAERKAAIIGLALLGIGVTWGAQVGYASLVDLNSGQVLWFNRLARDHGDLREAVSAAESIDVLLSGFPKVQ